MATSNLSPATTRASSVNLPGLLAEWERNGAIPPAAIAFRAREDGKAVTCWDEDGRQFMSLLHPSTD